MRQSASVPFSLSLLLLIAAGAFNGCATAPRFDTRGVDVRITPATAVKDAGAVRNRRVLWTGMVLNSKNLKDHTEIEVLAYPADSHHKPDLDREQLGRFLLEQPGYLETADYAQGRLITVVGVIDRAQEGRIGEASYTYPVLTAAQLHLWPKSERGQATEPRIHFGIGVILR